MKLRKKLLCHPGDKRHLAEDQGQDAPWGISTHRMTRKSGSGENSASCCPLGGGGREEGWHCLQFPVCAKEAAGMKTELGMRWNWQWGGRMRFGTSGVQESFRTGALEIGKGWVGCRNHSRLNTALGYPHTPDPFQTLKWQKRLFIVKLKYIITKKTGEETPATNVWKLESKQVELTQQTQESWILH